MGMNINRRSFFGGLAASVAMTGCKGLLGRGERPMLRLGVISDIHITTPGPESTDKFRTALREFRSLGADAVLVAGDLADWGLRSNLKTVKAVWDEVMGGADAVPLMITGNHDFDGWWYGDMTLDMHMQGYSEDEALKTLGMKACWEEIFHEPFADIRKRTVKGFDFVSVEWHVDGKEKNDALVAQWLEAHAAELKGDKPFFFFRHSPIPNTVSSSSKDPENALYRALQAFPNCVAFNGHTHRTLFDEGSVWQDGFTAVSIPSMEYQSALRGYENGSDHRRGGSKCSMPRMPTQGEHADAQGYFVSVFADRLEIRRFDFVAGEEIEPWILPWPIAAGKPFAAGERAKVTPVPEFPSDAQVALRVYNADTRGGHWTIFWELTFPRAMAEGGRVLDYEVRAEMAADGSVAAKKRFLSPAFHKVEREEPETVRVYFDGMDVPESGRYRLAVYPRNCFGRAGRPIFTRWLESKPGKAKAKGIAQQ